MSTDLIIYLVGGIVTWRLANLISKQSGPLAIFARFRAFLASRQRTVGGLFDLVTCTSCISMIMGAVTALTLIGGPSGFIVYTLSFSAIATILDHYMSKK